MDTIKYNDINIMNCNYKKGSFSKIDKYAFNGKCYALKKFNDEKYLNGKKIKINELNKINDDHLILPKLWVEKDGNKNQYLSRFCYGSQISKDGIIDKLMYTKELIKRMHEYKIIHCDLNKSNILFIGNDPFIIDFDNASYNNSKIDVNSLNDYSADYIKKLGINNGLDVYLFNLLTFSLLNEVPYFCIRKEVMNKNYKIFNFKELIDLFNSFFLDKGYSDNDYFIDLVSIISNKF